MNKDLKLLSVIPTDNWKLIFKLSDDSNRIIDYKDLDESFKFLAYPNQLKAFSFNSEEVKWKNGMTLDLETIISKSRVIELIDIEREYIYVGQKNQAPTDNHGKHHVFYVSLCPFSENPIMIGESIGGGHGESGGCSGYTIDGLREIKGWQDHFIKANCEWTIQIIDRLDLKVEETIFEIVKGIRNRSEFNK